MGMLFERYSKIYIYASKIDSRDLLEWHEWQGPSGSNYSACLVGGLPSFPMCSCLGNFKKRFFFKYKLIF